MFDAYRKIMNPTRIMGEVIEERILQSLMQSFYLRECRELIMLDSIADPHNPHTYSFERLHPFDGDEDNRKYFHPFCKAFREVEQCDRLCEHCDESRARALLQSPLHTEAQSYSCHIGLTDLVYAIHLANKPRGVLFAGQRVPSWDEAQMRRIREKIRITAPNRCESLLKLLVDESGDDDRDAQEQLDELKARFGALGATIQAAVSVSYIAKHAQAVQSAVAEVSEHLSIADMKFSWVQPIEDVLRELEALLEGGAIVFLVKQGNSYAAKAVSPKVTALRDLRVPAESFAFLDPNQWKCVRPTDLEYRELASRMQQLAAHPQNVYKLYRFEKTTDPFEPTASLSCIMVIFKTLETHELELPRECCRIFAHHAHVGIFMEKLSFTGHSMKTPIQVALLKLRRASRHARQIDSPEGVEIGRINDGVLRQLRRALNDAHLLETAPQQQQRPRVDITGMLLELIPQFNTLGEARGVTVVFSAPSQPLQVFGHESELRVALSNLLDNAVKYSYRGKEVRVTAQRLIHSVEIAIANYGLGIDSSKTDHLFTFGARAAAPDAKYERTGSGLGLAQAKQFIEGNQGSISIVFAPASFDGQRGVVVVKVVLPLK